MSVTAWKNCGVCVNDASAGTTDWTDEAEATLAGDECESDDDVLANARPVSGGSTRYLKCSDFSFSSADVPNGATIDGIEIEVRRLKAGGSSLTIASQLLKFLQGGSIVGNDIGDSGDWSTTETAVGFGGATELGGVSWDQTDIVASDFGCVIQVTFNTIKLLPTYPYALVDQVRMRVYYTEDTSEYGSASGSIIFDGEADGYIVKYSSGLGDVVFDASAAAVETSGRRRIVLVT